MDYDTARPGDRGELVVEIQDCLIQLGYLESISGVYDEETEEAVKRFQRKNGLAADFLEAGIVFTNPTCALCTAEHYGALPAGDVGVATNNRNFIGKVGKGSHTYLLSPMAAMATAVRGVITDPREFIQ